MREKYNEIYVKNTYIYLGFVYSLTDLTPPNLKWRPFTKYHIEED